MSVARFRGSVGNLQVDADISGRANAQEEDIRIILTPVAPRATFVPTGDLVDAMTDVIGALRWMAGSFESTSDWELDVKTTGEPLVAIRGHVHERYATRIFSSSWTEAKQ